MGAYPTRVSSAQTAMTRHVTVRPAPVGGVDRVDIAVEDPRALVDLFRIRRVRRRKLGGDREPAGSQHALESTGRGMTGKNRQRVAGNRLVFESHDAPILRGAASPFSGGAAVGFSSRTTRSHDERPARR
jgi:hypothetical protein